MVGWPFPGISWLLFFGCRVRLHLKFCGRAFAKDTSDLQALIRGPLIWERLESEPRSGKYIPDFTIVIVVLNIPHVVIMKSSWAESR